MLKPYNFGQIESMIGGCRCGQTDGQMGVEFVCLCGHLKMGISFYIHVSNSLNGYLGK